MKVFIFSKHNFEEILQVNANSIIQILNQVAHNTETKDLVVAINFLKHCKWIGGTAYVRKWLSPIDFYKTRGHWKLSNDYSVKHYLPERYKLIRLLFDLDSTKYPLKQNDRYGWTFHYPTFKDHLALLFAHELHHFRRYHLGMHQREGEQTANRWALNHVNHLGFQVYGSQIRIIKKRKKLLKTYLHKKFDPYKNFRHLPVGTKLLINFDPHGRYSGEIVTMLRPIRSNSKRIVIETSDSRFWRWPMEWLTVLT